MENNETNAARIAETVADILSKANLAMPAGAGAKIVIIVECPEPAEGPDMDGLSVARIGCDPCEAAAVCMRVVDVHHETHHHGDDDQADDQAPS